MKLNHGGQHHAGLKYWSFATGEQHGLPAQRILEISEELATDLIVVGVRRTPVHFEQQKQCRLSTAGELNARANWGDLG